MWNLQKTQAHIEATCGKGWLPLVEEVYQKLPSHLKITQAYQKWGELCFDLDQEDEAFGAILEEIQLRSSQMCEICGADGKERIVDNWVHTRCASHA